MWRILYLSLQWLVAAFWLLVAGVQLFTTPSLLLTLSCLTSVCLCAPPVRRSIAKRVQFFPRCVSIPLASAAIVASFRLWTTELDLEATKAGFKSYSDYHRAQKNGLNDTTALAAFDAREESKKRAAEAAKQQKEAECLADVQCLASRNTVGAALACKTAVERLANYDFKWTDQLLDIKFPKIRWRDQSKGQITFIGDSLKVQNGFGAWQNVVYSCDYDTQSKMVIYASAEPGRLSD